MLQLEHVKFYLGDTEHTIKSEDVTAETTLNSYIRDKIYLTGTKRMCLEGGCGACIVVVEENINGKKNVFAVNSCLVSVLSCHGWTIHTNEGIGNPLIGYHKLQTFLAENNGSQCGFCSSGMVMNMYALQQSGSHTMKEIENSFGGNLCRCTGYRPILTAFKKFASDAPKSILDIEDLNKCDDNCSTFCGGKECKEVFKNYCFELTNSKWVKVYLLKDLLEILKTSTDNYMLVAGNTARGVYKPTPTSTLPELYIDVTGVVELISVNVDKDNVTLGGNVTLTTTMNTFREIAKDNMQFTYMNDMADHIDLIATVPVRNIGTLAGNLMTKHKHNEFPSDIFLIMETFNATFVIVDTDMNEVKVSPQNFLQIDMTKKVLKSVILPGIDSSYKYSTYKIMPRAQNAHAMVNAGFLLKMNNNNVESARIVYGGINPEFIHASKTEGLIKSKNIFDNTALQLVLKSLYFEIQPDYVLPDPTPQYRKNLAVALFYKFVLKISQRKSVSSRYVSGGTLFDRPVSSGTQQFGTQKNTYPVSEPVIKLEALAQTSGQAQYIDDIPDLPNQLYAAFVTSKAPANSDILKTDASLALLLPGVVAYYDKTDIPGVNNFMPKGMGSYMVVQEEIFCSGKVKYYDQPVGMIVAKDHAIALKAAELVNITYSSPTSKPYLNVKDVLKANDQSRIHHLSDFVPKTKGTDVYKTIKGSFYMPWQYHFPMEVQCCNVVPTEDGIDMYPSSQWMDLSHMAAAAVLNIPMNKVNVVVRRLGGAFGFKVSRNAQISSAAALAAYKLKCPVKMWLPLETNMSIIGKRYPVVVVYEVQVNKQGVIQSLEAQFYSDYGVGGNEIADFHIVNMFQNCYDVSTWKFSTYLVNTDTAANTWARAPGTLEGLGAIESIMQQIGFSLDLDPYAVKMANMDTKMYPKLPEFWKDMKSSADIANRQQKIKEFNDANRWKKKGMSIVPMSWILEVKGNFTVLVSIFHGDGAVVVSHGGIEMGQGINTKVCQVAAYKFGIPLEKVAIKPSYSVVSPNVFCTANSFTSEAVCAATIIACDILLARIKPVRDKMKNPTWTALINQCFSSNIHLSASGFYSDTSPNTENYPIFGLCATEVEVDILTGLHQILRTDIIEDVGDSLSPFIDIGQLEGAFVMGIGYYTTEELIFDERGELKTNRTWNYKPPGAKDIPIDFRIKFPANNPSPIGTMHSKAIGEPPTCLSVTVPLAIRDAVASARRDADPKAAPWFPFDGPTTVEKTFLNSLNYFEQYKL